MKERRQIHIPAQLAKYEDRFFVKCNFCGTEAKTFYSQYGDVDWPTGRAYEIAETTIRLKTGQRYPESSSTKTKEIHACQKCFEEKVIPALEALGTKFEETDEYD